MDLAGLHRHDQGMFAKLRSHRPRPVIDPEGKPVALVAAPVVADAEVLGRIGRLRAALRDVGFNIDDLAGPEPAFFDELRNGHSVELGTAELEAVASHLGGVPASYVLAGDPLDELLRRIEAESVRMELRRDGFEVLACRGELPDDPEAMRRLSAYIREQMDIAVASLQAGGMQPQRDTPAL